MTERPRGLLLSLAAVLLAILAVSNLLKPCKLWGEHTGFVLVGHRLDGTANAIVGPLFGLYLLVYALGIGRQKRCALPMAYAYAAYVMVNLVRFIASHAASSGERNVLFGLVYALVAIGVSSGTALLLTKRRATLSESSPSNQKTITLPHPERLAVLSSIQRDHSVGFLPAKSLPQSFALR